MPSFLMATVSDMDGFQPDPELLSCVCDCVVVVSMTTRAGTSNSRLNPMSMFSTFSKADNVSPARLSMLIQDWLLLNLIVFPINIIYISI